MSKRRFGRQDLRKLPAQAGGWHWRPRRPGDELEDTRTSSGRRPGSQRCWAIGLSRGDCQQPNIPGEPYCYYHLKLSQTFVAFAEARFSPGPHGKYVGVHRCQGNATHLPGVTAGELHEYQCFDCGTRFAVRPRPEERGPLMFPSDDPEVCYPCHPLPPEGYVITSHPALKEAV